MLTLLKALRRTVNELRESADSLKDEIGLLEEDIEYMTYECSRYDGVERDLKAIVKNQGHSVDNVVMLVRQNEETLDLMRVSDVAPSYCSTQLSNPCITYRTT